MADYYPLIARAIAALDPNAPGESRRALYERARTALIAQLRSVQPPLSESEITRERLSLEEAVRKVESEAAQRARDASRPGSPRGGSGGGSGDAFRRASARAAETTPPAAPDAELLYYQGAILADCGKRLAALRLLQGAIEQNYCAYSNLQLDPMLRKVRTTPGFDNARCRPGMPAEVSSKARPNFTLNGLGVEDD